MKLIGEGRFASAVATCFVLNCTDAVIDTSNPDAYLKSLSAMEQPMDDQAKAALDRALHDIVLVEGGVYGDGLKAKMLTETPVTGGELAMSMMKMMLAGAPVFIEKGWAEMPADKKAQVVLDNAPAVIDGRTGDQLLRLAELERSRSSAKTRSVLESGKTRFQEDLKEAEAELEALKGKAEEKKKADLAQASEADATSAILSKFQILNPKFQYSSDSLLTSPTFSFVLLNGSSFAIQSFSSEIVVSTPGRSVLWLKSGVNYDVPGGVEPGETRHFDLQSYDSDWKKVPEKEAPTAVTTARIVQVTDASGKRTGEARQREGLTWLQKSSQGDDSGAKIPAQGAQIAALKRRIQDIDDMLASLPGATTPSQSATTP